MVCPCACFDQSSNQLENWGQENKLRTTRVFAESNLESVIRYGADSKCTGWGDRTFGFADCQASVRSSSSSSYHSCYRSACCAGIFHVPIISIIFFFFFFALVVRNEWLLGSFLSFVTQNFAGREEEIQRRWNPRKASILLLLLQMWRRNQFLISLRTEKSHVGHSHNVLVWNCIVWMWYWHNLMQLWILHWTKSSSTGAQYVTLQKKIGWRKFKTCWFNSAKWFWPSIFAQFAEACKRHSKVEHLPEKSVVNMIWLLLPVFDWPIIVIGPGGLLLVVSHLFAVPVWVIWVGWEKTK